MTNEVDERIRELIELEDKIDDFTDDLIGPWYYEDGQLFVPGKIGRQAPRKYHKRCHAPAQWSHGRTRCARWALKGRQYCHFHGGRVTQLNSERKNRMPAAYSKLLMPSLADRLEGFLNNGKTRQQQLELYEELAASRMIAEQLMTLMNATLSCGDKVNAETRIHAMRLAQDALNGVADLATKISRIEKDATDVVSVRALGFFVDQITTILHKRLSVVGQDEIAVQLAQDLREQIRLPAPGELADPNCPLGEIEVTYG